MLSMEKYFRYKIHDFAFIKVASMLNWNHCAAQFYKDWIFQGQKSTLQFYPIYQGFFQIYVKCKEVRRSIRFVLMTVKINRKTSCKLAGSGWNRRRTKPWNRL